MVFLLYGVVPSNSLQKDAKSQLLHWFGMTYNTFSFMLTKTSMYVILQN